MMQSYSDAGDFTVMGKFKSALLENVIIYSSFLLILIICIVYLALKPGFHFDRYNTVLRCSSIDSMCFMFTELLV